ncbi:MAG: DMT family transporter [Hyphomonas sp.]|nr:DMT family transporter [Hyphomonas sp.]
MMGVKPRFLAIIVMTLWASCYPLIALALDDAPHLTFAALRALLGGATLMLIALATGANWPKRTAEWGWIALAGVGMTGIGYFGMFHGAEFVAPGLATVISNTQPLIAGLLAAALLGERAGLLGWAGLVIGFAGIVVIAAPNVIADPNGTSLVGFGYVVLATTGVAIGNIAIRQLGFRVAPVMAMGLQLIIGAVLLAILAMALEDPTEVNWSARFVVSLAGLALPGTALAFWLWQITLAHLTVSRAVVFSFIVPVIGLTVGWALFDETITGQTVVGAVLSIAGVYLASRNGRKVKIPR